MRSGVIRWNRSSVHPCGGFCFDVCLTGSWLIDMLTIDFGDLCRCNSAAATADATVQPQSGILQTCFWSPMAETESDKANDKRATRRFALRLPVSVRYGE